MSTSNTGNSQPRTKLLYADLTEKIIGAAFEVHNKLGKGLSETVYQNALVIRLKAMGLKAEDEKRVPLIYEKYEVGHEELDLLVDQKVVVETKAVKKISPEHTKKLLSTLRNTHYQLGLIINFGESVQIQRVINSSQNK